MEFLLLSQAQEDPEGFRQVLMCEWLGSALGEATPSNHGSSGGFWQLLGFYKKQAIVEELGLKGVFFEELAGQVGADYDPFDLICHIAYDNAHVLGNLRHILLQPLNSFRTFFYCDDSGSWRFGCNCKCQCARA